MNFALRCTQDFFRYQFFTKRSSPVELNGIKLKWYLIFSLISTGYWRSPTQALSTKLGSFLLSLEFWHPLPQRVALWGSRKYFRNCKMNTEQRTLIPGFRGQQDRFLCWNAEVKAILKAKRFWYAARGDGAASCLRVTKTERMREMMGLERLWLLSSLKLSLAQWSSRLLVRYHLQAWWLSKMIHKKCDSSYISATAQSQRLAKPLCIYLLAQTHYNGQAMHEYVTKWELMSAHLASMGALIYKTLLVTMSVESFVDAVKSQFGSAISASLSWNTLTWQSLSVYLLQYFVSQQSSKLSSAPFKGKAIIVQPKKNGIRKIKKYRRKWCGTLILWHDCLHLS